MSGLRVAGRFLLELFEEFEGADGVELGLGVLRVHALEGGADDLGDGPHSVPLAIGGDDVPRRVLGVAFGDRVLVCVHVVLPLGAGLDVSGFELPVLLWIGESVLEFLALSVFGEVEVDFDDFGAAVDETLFEAVDNLIAFGPA